MLQVTEIDPAPHFASLFELLETVDETRDYLDPAVGTLASSGAAAARASGLAPEAMVAFLRSRVHHARLAAVGDWYRGVLAEQIVAQAITGYFDAGVPRLAGLPADGDHPEHPLGGG
jgi:hypothetical protein